MAGAATLAIKIIADASKATAEMKQVGDKAKGMGAGFKGVAGAVAGGLAIGAVVGFGKAAIGAAEESEKATAGLQNVFKQMGDSTGTAATEAMKYADELSALTAIEDETIIAAQTQLATFGAVSDETARTSGIFDRATAAAADLAAAGFGSMDSNAVALGKALNDPIKGIGALAKSGVTFTDAEKEMIAGMQEAGDMTGAQKVVLEALEKQVGGTAAATVTESERMTKATGDLTESVGAGLLPAFQALAPILQSVAGFLQENMTWILPLIGVILAVVAAIKIWAAVQWVLNSALWAGVAPFLPIILAVAALIAIGILVWKNWDKIVAFLKKAWEAIKTAATTVFGAVGRFITGVWNAVRDTVVGVWQRIKNTVTGIWNGIRDVAKTVFGAIGDFFGSIIDRYVRAFQRIWDFLKRFVDYIGTVGDAIAGMWEVVSSALGTAWSGVVDVFKSVVNTFIRGINTIISGINSAVGIINKIPGVNIGTIPKIPTLAQGGVLTRPTLFIGGEAGREIVTPERLMRAIVREEGGGGGYTLNMYPRRADPQDVAWAFRRLELARTGR